MIAVLLAALSGLSYGASDFCGGVASKRNEATVVTLVMQVISLLCLIVILVAVPRGEILAADLAWGALAGLGAAVGLTTFYRALADGPMSTAASVTALIGSLLPVVAGLALGEIPNAPTLAGVGVAVPAGVAVSIGGLARLALGAEPTPRSRARRHDRTVRTRRLSLVAGLGFGFFFVALAQTSGDGGLHPLLGARAASISALTVVVIVGGRWRQVTLTGGHRTAVVVAGILDCAANASYLLALEGGSFTWVAAVVSLYPVATVLLARLVLREHLARIQAGGLVAAAAALVLISAGAS